MSAANATVLRPPPAALRSKGAPVEAPSSALLPVERLSLFLCAKQRDRALALIDGLCAPQRDAARAFARLCMTWPSGTRQARLFEEFARAAPQPAAVAHLAKRTPEGLRTALIAALEAAPVQSPALLPRLAARLVRESAASAASTAGDCGSIPPVHISGT